MVNKALRSGWAARRPYRFLRVTICVVFASCVLCGLLFCGKPPERRIESTVADVKESDKPGPADVKPAPATQDAPYRLAKAHCELAEADRAAGLEDSALHHYRRAAHYLEEAVPGIHSMFTKVGAQKRLIKICIHELKDFERAERAIRHYEELRGKAFQYHADHFRAQMLIEQGRYEEAYEALSDLLVDYYYPAGPTIEGIVQYLPAHMQAKARELVTTHRYVGMPSYIDITPVRSDTTRHLDSLRGHIHIQDEAE